jgi:hypothetical protein
MADQQVIKEFLVKLGFKQDEASLKKFTNGVEGATKNVVKLVTAIQGASLTIAAGVTAFASTLEKMYFSAKRAGSSAISLKAIEQTLQNINGSGDDALNSVQALATFMRNQPGGVGYLKSLGVDALDAKGNMRDMADIMVDLGRQMRNKPYYLAKMQAEQLGIDEQTLRGMMDPTFEAQLKKQKAILEKSGFNKAAEDANKFMQMVRELQTLMQVFAVKVQDALMNKLGGSLQNLTEWVRKNGDQIATRIAEILMTILDVAEAIIPAIKWLVDKFLALDKATDGWSTKIILLVGALNLLGAGSLVAGVLSLAGAMGKLALPILAIAGAAAAGYKIGEFVNDMLPQSVKDKIGEYTAQTLAFFGNEEAQRAIGGAPATPGKAKPGKPGGGNASDPVRFFMGMGWSKDQAAGIVANLKHESSMNPKAVGDSGKAYGLAQWHPDRQANFKKWAGKDIRDSSAEEQMRFVNYELTEGAEMRAGRLLRAAKNAKQSGEIVSRYYERPKNVEAEEAKRGASAVQIAQTTEININGASDPGATARAVASEQGRVNADMTRNFNVALR